jgi:hypothetical protein
MNYELGPFSWPDLHGRWFEVVESLDPDVILSWVKPHYKVTMIIGQGLIVSYIDSPITNWCFIVHDNPLDTVCPSSQGYSQYDAKNQ